MAEQIASGEVHIGLNDEEVRAGLAKVDQEFHRTMERINREKAVAHIEAEMSGVEDAVANTKRKLRELDGEKAKIELGLRKGDVDKVDAELALVRKELKSLDGQRATMEVELKGAEKALATEAALRKSTEQTSRAYMKAENDRARVMQTAERDAIRRAKAEEQQRRAATVGLTQQVAKVSSLQKQYARLTDQLERVNKKNPIGREARAKVTLDAADVLVKMEAIKTELNFLGSHPPIDIKANVNRKGIVNKFKGVIADLGAVVGNKAAGIGDLTLRLGPFTSSIKGAITALGILGPTLTDVLGAAGALVGVLGAGIAGAATVGAGGLVGLASAGLGFKFALRNTGQEVAQARTSINAYQSAVLKFGKSSDKAKEKQQEMNSVLKQISPLARETALGVESFFRKWDAGTQTTQKNLGTMSKFGFQALDAIRPAMERQVNDLSGMAARAAKGVSQFFQQGGGKNIFGNILKNFDAAIPHLLHGLGDFGKGFLNVAQEGSRYLSMLTGGFDKLGGKLLGFTQRDDFGATVKRWVSYAQDLLSFFGALTRVVVHFFGVGSKAGDGLVKSMTNALNRWDRFIQSTSGHNKIADFFKNSVDGTKELYTALQPIVGLFALWAVGLEPAVRVITQIFSWVTKATAAVGKLVGLSSPLATLGSTIGAMWAVGKIGAFVSMLARAVSLMKELGAVGTLKSIFSGNFFGQLKGAGGSIASAGEAAAAEMRAGIIAGGTAAAAEMRGALTTGGGVSAAEGLLGPNGKPIRTAERVGVDAGETAAGGAAAGSAAKSFGALRTAVTGVGAAFGAESLAASALVTGGLTILAAGAAYGAYKLLTMKSASEKLSDAIHLSDQKTQAYGKTTHQLLGTMNAAGAEMKNYKDSVGRVSDLKKKLNAEEKNGGKDTAAYKETLSELNQALTDRETHYKNTQKLSRQASQLEQQATSLDNDRIGAVNRLHDAQKKRSDDEKALYDKGFRGKALSERLKQDDEDLAKAEANVAAKTKEHDAAQRRAQLGQLNYARGLAGLVPLAGRAATALVNLAKRAPNLAQTISTKYADPKDAANVANKATAALKSGTSSKIVLRIIADSKNAEDAIRRLQAAKLTEKRLNIVEHGGSAAVAMVERLIDKKLTDKQQRIIEHGGAAALAMLSRIIGKKLPTKTQHTQEQGSGNVISRLNQIIAIRIPAKTSTVTAVDHASGTLHGILGLIGAVHSVSATITTTHVTRQITSIETKRGHAKGRSKGRAETAMIGEGGRHEFVVDRKTGMGFKTPGPMLYPLNSDQYVIPTENKHKNRGTQFFREMARDLGIEGFAKGKKPHPHTHVSKPTRGSKLPLSEAGKAIQRTTAQRRIKATDIANRSALPEIDAVRADQQAESDQNDAIALAERRLKEPTTFIDQTGTDDNGNPIYSINQKRLKDWHDQLAAMGQMYTDLIALMDQMKIDTHNAVRAITISITSSGSNLSKLKKESAHEQRIIDSKHSSTSERTAARQRKGIYDAETRKQQKINEDATKDHDELAEEDRHGIANRRAGYVISRDEYVGDAAAVADDASSQLTDANPKPEAPTAADPVDPFAAVNGMLAALDAEGALAAIGQGINGKPPRTPDQIAADRTKDDQSIIDIAKGMLSDADSSNDADAYSAITGAANDIGSLSPASAAASGTSDAATAGAASVALSSARTDLYTGFANNAISMLGSGTAFPAYGGAAAPAAAPAAAGGTTVNLTNNFQTPPADPHTWSAGVAWELQATV